MAAFLLGVKVTTKRIPAIQRFQKFVKIMESGCHEWQGALSCGYGRFGVGFYADKSLRCAIAPRWIYEFTYGPIPEGMFVCHHCDNPKCVNVDHLFLGTPKDNSRDMVLKGRQARGEKARPKNQPRGERHGAAKLTVDQVIDIRKRIDAAECSQHALAREFGISVASVNYIVRRKRWAHIA